MGELQLHELTQSMRQKDMKYVNCLNKICTTVPLEGSEEDRLLQNCELKLNPNIHLMQCTSMHEMPTVMNGIHTYSHCCQEKNLQI